MLRKWISQWQEPVVWLPCGLLVAWGLSKAIPQLDPRSGVDGLGFLCGLAEDGLLIACVFFFTWLYRHTYGVSDEDGRQENAEQIRRESPRLFYIAEKLQQLAILIAVVYCFKR